MIESDYFNIQKTQSILLKLKTNLKYLDKRIQEAEEVYHHDVSCKLTGEFMEFMKTKNEHIDLIYIVRNIIKYIKDMELYKVDIQLIVPDEILSKLLKLEDLEKLTLTHFNIQNFILRALNKT